MVSSHGCCTPRDGSRDRRRDRPHLGMASGRDAVLLLPARMLAFSGCLRENMRSLRTVRPCAATLEPPQGISDEDESSFFVRGDRYTVGPSAGRGPLAK